MVSRKQELHLRGMGSIRNGISDAGLLFWKDCAGVIFQIYFISRVAGD
jgi:hypothetical protein